MVYINWKIKILICITLFILTSCSNVNYLKTYSGEPLPENNISFLVREDAGLKIYSIDSKRIPGGCSSIPSEHLKFLELLPGKHEIKFRYATVGSTGSSTFSTGGWFIVNFDALPGHTYKLASNIDYKESVWNPSVIDISDELRTAKKSLHESIDEAFTNYRQHPIQSISIDDNTILVNSYHFEISIDNDGTFHSLLTKYFKFLPGKHVLKVHSAVRRDDPPDTITFTAEAKHLYELIPYEDSFYNLKIIDITNEMDNVNEPWVDSINKFLKE